MPASKVLLLLPAVLLGLADRLPRVVGQQCANANDVFVDEGYPLSVGEKARFVLRPQGIYGWLRFAVCGPHSCSGVRVVDEEVGNGTLQFLAETTATNHVTAYYTVKRQMKGPVGVAEGTNYTFVMHRTTTESFDFWMEIEPSLRMAVDTRPDELRIKWASYIGSIYAMPEGARGDIVVAEGQDVKVKLVTAESQTGSALHIGLCGPQNCDKVAIYAVGEEPPRRLAYEVRRTHSNALHGAGHTILGRTGPDGRFPGNRNYTFVIQRRPNNVDVWLDGSPDSKITFASSNDILRVASSAGSTYFIYGRKEEVLKKFGATCGRAKAGPVDLVINGNKSSIDTVPWHAAVYQQKKNKKGGDSTWKGICGGTLVSPSTIVTAAHCVARTSGQPFPAADFAVALGKTLSGWDEEDGDETIYKSQVIKIHVHKWYRGHKTKLANDIAVLQISSCAKLGDNIFPICTDGGVKGYEEEPLKVPGWGDGDAFLAELESVVLSFVSIEECKRIMDSNLNELAYVTEDKLCSYRISDQADSQGLITGDSGGGAVIKRGGLWYFQGVVSSRLRGKKDGVDVDVYTFTDVTRHLGWVSRFLAW